MKTKTHHSLAERYTRDMEEVPVSLDLWHLKKNQNLEFIAREHKILLIIKGNLRCFISGCIDACLDSNQMIFISIGTRCLISTTEDASIICFKPGMILNIYSHPDPTQIISLKKISDNNLNTLRFTPIISTYVESLKWFLEINPKDPVYVSIKTRELFYLMSICYTLQERNFFFKALASKDKNFSDFIYLNYRKIKSINELASMSCYSRSGFEKRFRKIFGIPASHWIALRRAADIYHEIRQSRKSIKQICFDYGFSSLSHFHKFCKSKFGLSPGYIRKQVLTE